MEPFHHKYDYHVFISYRQNDNTYDAWVTEFVSNLRKELVATIKGKVNIYFDENPHDGVLETHHVIESLKTKLQTLIFIPIISQTYCDPESFAWKHEFLEFLRIAEEDEIGLNVPLSNGNVASRVLPVKIHEIDVEDSFLLEETLGSTLRSIDFIYKNKGVNRPLDSVHDDKYRDDNQHIYRDQINKVANGIKEILIGISQKTSKLENRKKTEGTGGTVDPVEKRFSWVKFIRSAMRREMPLLIFNYVLFSLIAFNFLNLENFPFWVPYGGVLFFVFLGLLIIILAWNYEFGPEGIIRTNTWESRLNPFPRRKRKPFTSFLASVILLAILLLQRNSLNVDLLKNESQANMQQEYSLLVAPFTNGSKEVVDSLFLEGLTSQMTSRFSALSNMIVIDYSDVRNFLNTDATDSEIFQKYNIGYILRTTLMKFDDEIHYNYRLVDAKTSRTIGGITKNIKENELFDVQREVVLNVMNELGIVIDEKEKLLLESNYSQNLNAYNHYFKGLKYYESRDSLDYAILEYQKALDYDSAFVLPLAGVTDVYSLKYRLENNSAFLDTARSIINYAISLNSESAECYKALANVEFYSKNYTKAKEYFRKAIEIRPNYAQVLGNLAILSFTFGELDESIEMNKKALKLQLKSDYLCLLTMGWAYRLLGDLDNSKSLLSKAIDLNSKYPDSFRELGYTQVLLGNKRKAKEIMSRVFYMDQQVFRNYEEAGLIAFFANELDSAKKYFTAYASSGNYDRENENTITPLILAYFKLSTTERDKALE
ncbi:MAG: tetratricopeptide repeat protein, partial [Cyclobacteriaceae bacterium]|nr:tetratricopeptide repeat protein [Cyclobacteriaceae bacterium]